jgi:hypothetical protein
VAATVLGAKHNKPCFTLRRGGSSNGTMFRAIALRRMKRNMKKLINKSD